MCVQNGHAAAAIVIVQAPTPSRPIERGIAAPGLLARVLVAKSADPLPLYRQSAIYAREGGELDRALLRPLVDAMGRHVLTVEKSLAGYHRHRSLQGWATQHRTSALAHFMRLTAQVTVRHGGAQQKGA